MESAPLAGLRVIDFGLLLPSPYASRLLADLGADVVCIHPPTGDPAHQLLPGLAPYLAKGKRSVRIDLKTPEGLDAALDFIASADVVLEGFRPGVADRLGIGFQAASRRNPTVIYCSISGYGQDGPSHSLPAHDGNIEASGGAFAGVLAVGETPPTPYLPVADLSASMFAALSVVAAVLSRTKEPATEAVRLDVSMQESLLQFGLPRWGRYLLDGSEPVPEDLVAYSAGAGVFPTADGRHVALAAIEDHFWTALCHALDRPELAAPPFETHTGRTAHREHLRTSIGDAISQRPAHDLIAHLEPRGVPISLVRTVAEVAQDPHLLARGAIKSAEGGTHVPFPVTWSGQRLHASARENSLEALFAEVGAPPERLQELLDRQVVSPQ